jgi:glutaminyl-tRNA synthetase
MSEAESDKKREDDGPGNFVREIVASDLAAGKNGGRVMTRFPPEPNGYLHVGHAKSICLNFGLARDFEGGVCNLRFDDTNPETEDVEYVESIKADIRWLGFEWDKREYYASDYFGKLYDFAVAMIKAGVAYVDSRTEDEIRDTRGDFYKPGVDSPHRNRSVDENLDLFARMKAGEFKDGEHVLRAKGDMKSTDVKMRDPLMYRIRHAKHHRTGDAWCIYPMYDWAHGQSDFIENVTHSICTLEFVNHRPLYNWFLDQVGAKEGARPTQTEFAKLNITYTVLSKRRLKQLVTEKHVDGWDDPRMPTLSGMRRLGVTPEALRAFCDRVGVSTKDSIVDIALYEHTLREDLNARCPRVMGVLDPLKVTLENFPENETIEFDAPYDPEKPEGPSRKVPLTRTLYIEREDFAEVPAKKWFRLAPGQEVRLRYACLIKCTRIVKNDKGEITELVCTWDPDSRGGAPKDGRKVKGTLHWVSATHGVKAEARVYDRLWLVENPMEDKDDWLKHKNPKSLEVKHAVIEPSLASAKSGDRFQFERLGYFIVDPDTKPGALVFNRTISLKDTWAAIAAKS